MRFVLQLRSVDERLSDLAQQAELCAATDPTAALVKMRTFAELLARLVGKRNTLERYEGETAERFLERLGGSGCVPDSVLKTFHELRMAGNAAAHEAQGTRSEALESLSQGDELARWFVESGGVEGQKSSVCDTSESPRSPDARKAQVGRRTAADELVRKVRSGASVTPPAPHREMPLVVVPRRRPLEYIATVAVLVVLAVALYVVHYLLSDTGALPKVPQVSTPEPRVEADAAYSTQAPDLTGIEAPLAGGDLPAAFDDGGRRPRVTMPGDSLRSETAEENTSDSDLGALAPIGDTLVVSSNIAEVTVPSAPASGLLRVKSAYDVTVSVDGYVLFSARGGEALVAAGKHSLRLFAPAVLLDATVPLEVSPSGVEINTPELVSVRLNTRPANCKIWVEGRYLDDAPAVLTAVEGDYVVEYRWPNGSLLERTLQRTIRLRKGMDAIYERAP